MSPRPVQDYPFVRVEGDGVHEIPVGPVHAGIIEPGHFRFSVVGEKVLRLEQRLGYTHKGIEQRFTRLRAAGRPQARRPCFGRLHRGLCLGLLHGAGIGRAAATCRNARSGCARCCWSASGSPTTWATWARWATTRRWAFGLAQFSRLREDWLRLSSEAFGHRLMMDCVVPGGVAADLDAAMRQRLRRQCDAIEAEVRALRAIYESHAGLQDRFADDRQRRAAAGGAAGPDRPGGPRQRAACGPALRPGLAAL